LSTRKQEKNNSKTSNKQQKEKSDRGEILLEPTVEVAPEVMHTHTHTHTTHVFDG
jgi:hypothetical protein